MRKKLTSANIRIEARRQRKVHGDFTIKSLARALDVTCRAILYHVDKEVGFRSELEIMRGWTLTEQGCRPRKMIARECEWICFKWLAQRFALPPEVRKFQARIRLS